MIDEPEDDDDLLPFWGEPLLDPLGAGRRAAEAEAKMPRRVAKPTSSTPTTTRTWTGTKRALGDKALAMYHRGEINAKSAKDAVRIVCAQHTDQNGNPIDPKNVMDNLKIRNKFEGK